MTLGKEASIAADSTMTSSPAQAADASPQIRRATRTYGKRREELPAEGTAHSVLYAASSLENIHKTAPPGLKETIPASSPEKMPMDPFDAFMENHEAGGWHNAGKFGKDFLMANLQSEQEDFLPKDESAGREKGREIGTSILEESNPDSQSAKEDSFSKFSYSWRGKLAEIDKAFEDDVPESTSISDKPNDILSFGKAMLLREPDSSVIRPASTSTGVLTPPPFISDDVFNGPPSTLSCGDAPHSFFSLSSPHRSRRPKICVVRDSDSEEELPKGSSSTARSTSGHDSFVSAKSRSLSTPPTSDEDIPSKISMDLKLSHSRKSDISVSVPPPELSSKERKRGRKSRRTKVKVIPGQPTVKTR
jgi:hypothetical protein